jgi:hypothetical protein
MTAVKLSGTFKKDERPLNGLEAIAKELLDRDRRLAQYVVVAVVRPHSAKWNAEDGTEIPTVKFDQVEVLEGDAATTARELLDDAYHARTGKSRPAELPLEMGEDD